ncbi:hypothetical protein [Enterococcus sp.]|uniref:hypothetical protein n=1 Tax=Enterococcus sp. TaxID=35783 RepID=UPI0028984C91|nr:hypothetical protein [Enterococcus sp.]
MKKKIEIDDLVTKAISIDCALKGFRVFMGNQFSMRESITTEDLSMANALLVSILELSGRHADDIEAYMTNLGQGDSNNE